jgi:predicted RNA binding protein YcfA (HicA-like mRNA interferase family)
LQRGRFISMPPKIRELIAELERAGFTNRGGRGSHRNFKHPKVAKPVTIPVRSGDDAQSYLVKQVKAAIEESKS